MNDEKKELIKIKKWSGEFLVQATAKFIAIDCDKEGQYHVFCYDKKPIKNDSGWAPQFDGYKYYAKMVGGTMWSCPHWKNSLVNIEEIFAKKAQENKELIKAVNDAFDELRKQCEYTSLHEPDGFMNNLAKTNQSIITITQNGDSFISQTKLAEMCGVSQQAISKHIRAQGCRYISNEFNQLDDKSAFMVVGHYAAANTTALKSLIAIGAAGMKAYIYSLAGYQMEAKIIQQTPKTALELAREQVFLLEQIEIKDHKIKKLEMSEEISGKIRDLHRYEIKFLEDKIEREIENKKTYGWRK
jgi:hypothetical protein